MVSISLEVQDVLKSLQLVENVISQNTPCL